MGATIDQIMSRPGIAEEVRNAVMAEREACAKIADKQALICFDANFTERTAVASAIADAIRARTYQE